MAKQYAAMKMKMGEWEYYSVKMRMQEVATEIDFASNVQENPNKILDSVIQRQLTNRKGHIKDYLVNNDERFFNSIVVAAFGGSPQFVGVEMENVPNWATSVARDTFGILQFDDSLDVYALDGQHRLSAIKMLIEEVQETPPGFKNETLSVIFVVPREGEDRASFLKSYRRLFSNLNRHAKPMDKTTVIIMEEDDRFAIATRRLLQDFEFFFWDGQDGNPRIYTEGTGKSLPRNSPALTNLICLYEMNLILCWDAEMQNEVGPYKGNHKLLLESPTDDESDEIYEYLEKMWDALIQVLPQIGDDPVRMRRPGADGTDTEDDNLLFRPMGQTNILAPIMRALMNENSITKQSTTEEIKKALNPLKHIPWSLQHNVWRDLLTIYDQPTETWKMRNEDSALVEKVARSILMWVVNLSDLPDDDIDGLQERWAAYLIVPQGAPNDRENDTFQELREIRELIANEL